MLQRHTLTAIKSAACDVISCHNIMHGRGGKQFTNNNRCKLGKAQSSTVHMRRRARRPCTCSSPHESSMHLASMVKAWS